MTSLVMRLKMTRVAHDGPTQAAPVGQTAFAFGDEAPEQAAFAFAEPTDARKDRAMNKAQPAIIEHFIGLTRLTWVTRFDNGVTILSQKQTAAARLYTYAYKTGSTDALLPALGEDYAPLVKLGDEQGIARYHDTLVAQYQRIGNLVGDAAAQP